MSEIPISTPTPEKIKQPAPVQKQNVGLGALSERSLALLGRQEGERVNLLIAHGTEQSQVRAESLSERRELLTDKARASLYEAFGIDVDLAKNSSQKKLLKGVADGMIFGNMELVEMVARDPSKVIEIIKALTSLEGLKKAAKAIGKSFTDLFSGNAYDTGKSLGELAPALMGGVAFGMLRKGSKAAIKNEMKLAVEGGIKEGTKGSAKEAVKEGVLKNAVLSNTERLAQAEKILARPLTKTEKQAILQAHNAGEGTVYTYTKPELRVKSEIMKNAGIPINERRMMMEAGVTGKPLAQEVADTLIVPMLKMEPRQVGRIVLHETEKIADNSSNLSSIGRKLQGETKESVRREIQRTGNDWIGGRLDNMAQFLQYAESMSMQTKGPLMITRQFMRNQIGENGLRQLYLQFSEIRTYGFEMSLENKVIMKQLALRMKQFTP